MTQAASVRCGGCGAALSRYNRGALCAQCEKPRARTPVAQAAREQWLWTSGQASAPPDGSQIGALLKSWRKDRRITQVQLAERLGFTQPYISMVEKGTEQIRDIGRLRHISAALAIPPEDLGLLPDQSVDSVPAGVPADDQVAAEVAASRRAWKAARQHINEHRSALSDVAASLYPQAVRPGGSAVISRPEWMTSEPVELADIALEWCADVPPATLTGVEVEAEPNRPLKTNGEHYDKYSRAMADLARPRLFENRPGYRLVDLAWANGRGRMAFGYTSYFGHGGNYGVRRHVLKAHVTHGSGSTLPDREAKRPTGATTWRRRRASWGSVTTRDRSVGRFLRSGLRRASGSSLVWSGSSSRVGHT